MRTWNKLVVKIIMLPLILSLTGCVYLVVGGVGALGGYVVSPDTVEGITEADSIVLWDTSLEIAAIMGQIHEASEEEGVLLAKIQGTKVTVTITSLTATSSKLSVKARKAFLPKIAVAQDVFVKIMSNVIE